MNDQPQPAQTLYNVTVEFRVFVAANSREEAEAQAERSLRYRNCDPDYTDAVEIKSLGAIDEDWRDCIPYGEKDDRTCAEIWDAMQNQPEAVREQLEAAGQTTLFQENIA